jgi:hypothetical protein
MPETHPSAGDTIPPNCQLIEVRVGELKQLFNAMDPSPFRERDLDPNAEEFIVGWARDLPERAPLGLVVYLDRPAGLPEEPSMLRDAVHEFFSHKAVNARQKLRQLFRLGRTSLLIGVICLGTSIVIGNLAARALSDNTLGDVLRESLLIGGWVAMWRPLEIFLYDWWPIRDEGRLYDRLRTMSVRIVYANERGAEKWRTDWPAVSPPGRLTHQPLAYSVNPEGAQTPDASGSH